ncbi:MAG: hypothetical protein ACRDC3_15200 [Paraclostridium dentum]|uniref:hypothetical protein n=1 Tax=Paraclostridium dentum TaxID=2662455 RepID=UPI003EE53492
MGFYLYISIYKNGKAIVKTYNENNNAFLKHAYFAFKCKVEDLKTLTFKFHSCQNGIMYATKDLKRINVKKNTWIFKHNVDEDPNDEVIFHFMDYSWEYTLKWDNPPFLWYSLNSIANDETYKKHLENKTLKDWDFDHRTWGRILVSNKNVHVLYNCSEDRDDD